MPAGFLSDMEVRQLCDGAGHPVLSAGRSQWVYTAPLQIRDRDGFVITVPAIPPGLDDAQLYALWLAKKVTSTDFASIPRPCWDALPPDGPWVRPAGGHDFLYKTKGSGVLDGRCWITKPGGYTREQADQLLDDLMAAVGVDELQRVTIYEAVRAGGWTGWGD